MHDPENQSIVALVGHAAAVVELLLEHPGDSGRRAVAEAWLDDFNEWAQGGRVGAVA